MAIGRGEFELHAVRSERGVELAWARGGARVLTLPGAACLEITAASQPTVLGVRRSAPYVRTSDNGGVLAAEAEIETPWASFSNSPTSGVKSTSAHGASIGAWKFCPSRNRAESV